MRAWSARTAETEMEIDAIINDNSINAATWRTHDERRQQIPTAWAWATVGNPVKTAIRSPTPGAGRRNLVSPLSDFAFKYTLNWGIVRSQGTELTR